MLQDGKETAWSESIKQRENNEKTTMDANVIAVNYLLRVEVLTVQDIDRLEQESRQFVDELDKLCGDIWKWPLSEGYGG